MKTIRNKKIADALAKFQDSELKKQRAFMRVVDASGRLMESVVFLKEEDGEILAVMPYTMGSVTRDRDTMSCYSHEDQHTMCTYDYAAGLPLATPEEYQSLKEELEWEGYYLGVLDRMPDQYQLVVHSRRTFDSYKQAKRGKNPTIIEDARAIGRGDEIQYKGKKGTVQYALFHGADNPVIVRWQNEDGSEEFEVPYDEVESLKIHDAAQPDKIDEADIDKVDENEVSDDCGKKKKTKDGKDLKIVKIFKRGSKVADAKKKDIKSIAEAAGFDFVKQANDRSFLVKNIPGIDVPYAYLVNDYKGDKKENVISWLRDLKYTLGNNKSNDVILSRAKDVVKDLKDNEWPYDDGKEYKKLDSEDLFDIAKGIKSLIKDVREVYENVLKAYNIDEKEL